jgi:hypothetical protein
MTRQLFGGKILVEESELGACGEGLSVRPLCHAIATSEVANIRLAR